MTLQRKQRIEDVLNELLASDKPVSDNDVFVECYRCNRHAEDTYMCHDCGLVICDSCVAHPDCNTHEIGFAEGHTEDGADWQITKGGWFLSDEYGEDIAFCPEHVKSRCLDKFEADL